MKGSMKSGRVIDGYTMKKQLHGGFKVVEYSHTKEQGVKKRTLYKNLTITDAENIIYKLEHKLHI